MWIVWSRERAEVFLASPDRTRGRMPTNTLRTSARLCKFYKPWPSRGRCPGGPIARSVGHGTVLAMTVSCVDESR